MEETGREKLSIASIFAMLLKISKLFKVAKPALLFGSMAISAIAYTFLLGPWLAILFVALLLVHEMGHVAAMKLKGFATPTPVFIPFFGAAVFAPSFGTRDTEAFVAYGGPLIGTIGTFIVFGIWFLLPKETPLSHVLLVGSYLGAFLNLFNMLPISPLDGGRITQAIGPWFKYLGFTALALFSVYFREPVVLYIWIIVLFDFSILPLKVRAVLVPLLWASMATLMLLGFGDQPTWLNVADCLITLPFVVIVVARALRKEEDVTEVARPELPLKERILWLVLYSGLVVMLCATLVIQTPFLPQQAG